MPNLPYIPAEITVHLGAPDEAAQNVTVPFVDYIKNVASSEVYPTWPESALRANIYAQISFALNRIYTEYYRSRGYDFDITNSTAYDQSFFYGRDIFGNVSDIVDEIFNSYLVRQGFIEPLFAQYCDGDRVTCPGLSQWGSLSLAEQGYTPYQILTYYYGDDIDIVKTDDVRGIEGSVPAVPLLRGSSGPDVQTIQNRLNRIATNYPAIPKISPVNGVFGESTEESVRAFQRVFGLAEDGIIGEATWYAIQRIWNAVKRLSELYSEGLTLSDVSSQYPSRLALGSTGQGVEVLQYYLRYVAGFLATVPSVEVDGVFGIGANGNIAACIESVMNDFTESFPDKAKMPLCGDRELSTPSYFAYLKIAEGCDNKCTYCAIPMIRGGFRSRTMESIEEEAQALVDNGAKELILIAQDTSRYGLDLYGEYSLAKLLRRLCKIEKLHWIRVLYCYPDAITDELLDVMAEEEKVVKYIDLPLQHASGKVLKAMNRRGNKESLLALVKKIREKIPGVTLRTTMITGFPGETEEDFTELAEFVKEAQFERLGCFAYSQEENTMAGEMPDQIDEEIRNHRAEIIMDSQMNIMDRIGEKQVGREIEVLTEGFDRYAECWFGRSAMDAPDIDGKVFFSAEQKPYLGQLVTVHGDVAIDCDLYGTRV